MQDRQQVLHANIAKNLKILKINLSRGMPINQVEEWRKSVIEQLDRNGESVEFIKKVNNDILAIIVEHKTGIKVVNN